MAIDKLQLLKVRAQAFRSSHKSASQKEKSQHVSLHTAQNFNKLLGDVAGTFPDLADQTLAETADMQGIGGSYDDEIEN